MLPFSVGELSLIFILMVVLIGPKDLPGVLRTLIKMWRTYTATLKNLSDQSSSALSSVEKAVSATSASAELSIDKPIPETTEVTETQAQRQSKEISDHV